MDHFDRMSAERPIIFFNSTCPPCRWMSQLAVRMSLCLIRRAPLSELAASSLYEHRPDARGQIVMLYAGRYVFGRPVFAALPLTMLRYVGSCLRRGFEAALNSTASPGDRDPRASDENTRR